MTAVRAGIAMVVLLAACATAPPAAIGPAARGREPVSEADDAHVHGLLVTSCAPCHSAVRSDPWFAKLAPSSWSTRGARAAFDLSDWDAADAVRRATLARAVATVVEAGTMPPADYTFFNRAARVADAQKQTVVAWAARHTAMASH